MIHTVGRSFHQIDRELFWPNPSDFRANYHRYTTLRRQSHQPMMTSPNGTFSALQTLCEGNPPITGLYSLQGQWHGALIFSLIFARTNGWPNNRDAGDLRRHQAHYDVTVVRSGGYLSIVRKLYHLICQIICKVPRVIFIFDRCQYSLEKRVSYVNKSFHR